MQLKVYFMYRPMYLLSAKMGFYMENSSSLLFIETNVLPEHIKCRVCFLRATYATHWILFFKWYKNLALSYLWVCNTTILRLGVCLWYVSTTDLSAILRLNQIFFFVSAWCYSLFDWCSLKNGRTKIVF